MEKVGFFSLGEVFMGIGMGLGGQSMQKKYFGNMTHPIVGRP